MFNRTNRSMRKKITAALYYALLIFTAFVWASDEKNAGIFSPFYQAAECQDYPPAASSFSPSRNDVSIRTLKFRPDADILTAINDFYATRLDWVYFNNKGSVDKDNISKVKSMGVKVGGACNGEVDTCIPGPKVKDVQAWRKQLAVVDLKGEPVVFSWKTWAKEDDVLEADTTNPDYFDAHLAYIKALIDKGCTSIQRDEAGSDAMAAARYGGGFSKSGIKGFNVWLRQNVTTENLAALGIDNIESFDYKQYLIKKNAPVGVRFNQYKDPLKDLWLSYWDQHASATWQRLSEAVKQYAAEKGIEVQLSCNNSSLQLWGNTQRQFDFAMSELMAGTAWPGHLHNRGRAARSCGKHQMFNCPKIATEANATEEERVILTRKVIATAYSIGHTCQVPWDKWNSGDTRYFGRPQDYADLFAFVRANDWSGYSEVGAIGAEIEQRQPELENIIAFEGGSGYVYGFLNLDVNNPEKPLLLFLVDWGKPLSQRPAIEDMSFLEEGANGSRLYFSKLGIENIKRTPPLPFSVCFTNAFDGAGDSVKFSLLQPQPYNKKLYKPANQVKDYSNFVKTTTLKPSIDPAGRITIKLPALTPWAVLKIDKKE